MYPQLRAEHLQQLIEMGFDGYAIGGLSVGEDKAEMDRVLSALLPHMPVPQPRYLMGVGRPQDILRAVACGVDMFDCVLPTRNGRNAFAFTSDGPLRLKNACHRRDPAEYRGVGEEGRGRRRHDTVALREACRTLPAGAGVDDLRRVR